MRKNPSGVVFGILGVITGSLVISPAPLVWAQDAAPAASAAAPAPAVAAPSAPATQEAPAAADLAAAPASAATASAAPVDANTWLTVKGDIQRTSARNVTLPLPLNLKWRHTTEGEPGSATAPIVTGSEGARRIYFAAGSNVYCISGETGEQLWKSAVLTRPVTAPISLLSGGDAGDMILAITSNGRISALRTTDGGQIWEADARSPVQAAAPVLVNTSRGERIVVAIAMGRLLAFTREGAIDPNWEVKLGRLGAAPTSTPALTADGRYLFLTAQDQKLYCIDVNRGAIVYTVQLSTTALSSPMVLGDQVVVAAGQVVSGYHVRTGELAWRTNTEARQITASPSGTMAGGAPVVYIGGKNGLFYAIDATKGNVLWKTDLGASITGTATVLNNAILTGTQGGVMYALKPEDGNVLWQYRLHTERQVTERPVNVRNRRGGGRFGGGRFAMRNTVTRVYPVTAAPAIVGDQAFVLGDNAAVYAFDATPFDAAPPRALEPSLSVPAREGGLYTALLSGGRPLVVPGKAPAYLAVQLDDAGSGIDPNSIRVTANGEELPKERVVFQAASGVLTATLNAPQEGNVAVNLPDGAFAVTVIARDYAGNSMNYSGRFTVDNSVQPPTDQEQRRRRRRRQNPEGEGGGFPDGGFPQGEFPQGGFGEGGFGEGGFGEGTPPGGFGEDGFGEGGVPGF
jgi:outer membrane protein assembly factor BamB